MTLADELAALPESLQDKCFLTEDEKAILRRAVEALRAADAIIDALPDCDEPRHPAWCCAHQIKYCTMREDVANLRAMLDGSRPSAATEE